jgi:hypothetical protein
MQVIKSFAILGTAVVLASCAGSPAPLGPSVSPSAADGGQRTFGVLAASEVGESGLDTFARCLAGTNDSTCFSATSFSQPSVTFPHVTSVGSTPRVTAADAVTPDPPTNLTSSVYGSSVYLYWRAPAAGPTPATYYIEAGSVPGASDLAGFVTGTVYTSYSTNVSGGGTFYVRVRSVAAGVMSAPSNEILITVADPAIPGAPYGVNVSVSGTTVTLRWYQPYVGAAPTSYVIQASDRPGGPANLANLATGNTSTTFTATGVAGGTYFVRILAANSRGVGPASNEVSVIVIAPAACTTAPGPAANLVSFVSASTVTLGWTLSPGTAITSYAIEVGSTSGATDLGSYDTGSPAGSATFNGVGRGTYYVRVRGRNACGLSGPSNEIIVRVT